MFKCASPKRCSLKVPDFLPDHAADSGKDFECVRGAMRGVWKLCGVSVWRVVYAAC